MKVLQINSVCGYGSTGRIAIDLYKVLEEQGHECLIAYGRGTAPKEINSIRIGGDFDNYMHVAKTRLLDKHGFSSTKATKKFIEKIKEYNPDVVHLHNIHGYYINIELLFNYLKEANKPVVWTLHDCWAFTGHCAHFDYIKCEKWKDGCNNCMQKNIYPSSLLKSNSKYNYYMKKKLFTGIKNMTIVTPSNWLANLVEESFLAQYPMMVINNGVDLKVFKPISSNFREKYQLVDKFVILGVASIWNDRKGLEYFAELALKLNDPYKIVLVGIAKNQMKKLPKNIIGITRTNDIKELVEIYSAADVFVNPTVEEVMGLVNVEALACGIPVITFNTGGSVECINDNCGIVVRKKNVNELISAISNIEDKKFNKEDCMNKAMLYDKRDRYNDYVCVYKEIIRCLD